ncbi:MAG: type I-E CRISPR-associated protein Cse1/CasA [Cellulomonadaceae bacterium]|jgi:CRISPR system Cascade subunit CasA|nr:type I-E CRISPR-associated protein Cse1/CasA [Cellulomonadaceae bacterium]
MTEETDVEREPFFNLVDEPWIPVLDAGGTTREVSLRQVFHQSGDLVTLTGELPTQSVAILRVLLAVLHRAVQGPRDIDEWREVRDHWEDTLEDCDQYLDEWHDRFWMQHSVHPFMQVPGLHTAKDEVFALSRILSDGSGSSSFMSTRLNENLTTLSWSEAARWLIHVHAYDVSGIHSGAVGDPRVRGGKGYAIGTGWAGQLGVVYLQGSTLRETLILNLIAPSFVEINSHGDGDSPVWEREALSELPEGWISNAGANQHYRQPTGPVDLYTWPSRRIRLFGNSSVVTGVINAQGDKATPQNRHVLEPMTSWRYSEPQTKKLGTATYMPLTHQPERSLWRGVNSLLPNSSHKVQSSGPALRLPPALTKWASLISSHSEAPMVCYQSVGISYGTQESVIEEIWLDSLEIPSAILTNERLSGTVIEAVDIAQKAVAALGNLAQNVALASGGSGDDDSPRTEANSRGYAMLDIAFREWVRHLTDANSESDQRIHWQESVLQLVTEMGNEIVDTAGPAALVGRTAQGQFRDAGLALVWFRKKLRDVLPLALVNQKSSTEKEEVSKE